MNSTTTSDNLFHPYKIVMQGRTTLQLQPGAGQKAGVYVLRIMPLIMLIVGIILYVVQKQILFLAVFGGIALLEFFIFSVIKIPAAISMDSMGFTLETFSVKGRQETYYLWSDVESIRHKTITAKNSTSLSYEALLNTGKKISFLSFPNYQAKKNMIAQINETLTQISHKQIAGK